MSWIKVEQSLIRHRKILLGAQIANMDEHKFMGHVIHFWLWALDHADDEGMLPGLTHDVLGESAGLTKRHGRAFIESLITVGLLDVIDQRLLLHDWPEYAGKLNERRTKEKQRLANKRATLHQQTRNGTRGVA